MMTSKVKIRCQTEICQPIKVFCYAVTLRFAAMLKSGIIVTTAISTELGI